MLVCPVCGALYRESVPAGVVKVRCSYCGVTIVVPIDSPSCPNHPDVLATGVCNDCGSGYCRDCLSAYEVQGQGEGGFLQLCPVCLARRHENRAVRTVLMGILFTLFGIFVMLFSPFHGIVIILIAVPFIVYAIYPVR